MNIKDKISSDLNVPSGLIEEAIREARSHVKKFNIKKRDGTDRVIFQPSKKLKTIQYWLIINIFEKIAVHDAAVAYRKGMSILDNAILHKKNRFFLKIDLKNFFPSIKFSDLITRLRHWHSLENPDWLLDTEAEEIIRLTCFFKNDTLAVGYPSSPIISNIVMLDFDCSVSNLIMDKKKFGEVMYTRYADDLIFSTDKIGACNELLKVIPELISKTNSPKIEINQTKTKIGSSTGGSASVTGLKICQDGRITIHRKQKDHVRLLLSLYQKGDLSSEEHQSLLGHLAFIHYVDAAFYTKLQNKYFNEIAELKLLAEL